VEKDNNGTKGNKTDRLLKEITDTLSSLQKEVQSLKDSQARRTSLQSKHDSNKQNATENEIFKCYYCGKPGHMKRQCKKYLALLDYQRQAQKHPRRQSDMTCKDNKDRHQGNLTQLSCGASEAIHKAGDSGIFIEVKLGEKSLEFLVDTGATVTILSKDVLADICADRPLQQLTTDVLIADGTPLKVYGSKGVKFSIQDMVFDHTMVVADLSIDGILGLDFLRAHQCSVDLNGCSLTFGKVGKSVACQYKGKIGCSRVILYENLEILPESEVVTYRDVPNQDTQCFHAVGIVEPCKQFNDSDRALGDGAFSEHVVRCVMKEYACEFCDFTSQKGCNVKRHMKRAHASLTETPMPLGQMHGTAGEDKAADTAKGNIFVSSDSDSEHEEWMSQDPGDLLHTESAEGNTAYSIGKSIMKKKSLNRIPMLW
jgi:predicted aspartyl protease